MSALSFKLLFLALMGSGIPVAIAMAGSSLIYIQATGIAPDFEVRATRQEAQTANAATPAREREQDLRRSLRAEGAATPAPPTVTLPPLNLPASITDRVQNQPPENWPALDITKPETDFQLQQGLSLVRAMAANPQRRAQR